jgi:hypothetical protein
MPTTEAEANVLRCIYFVYNREETLCTAKFWEEADAPAIYGKKDTCIFLLELHPWYGRNIIVWV